MTGWVAVVPVKDWSRAKSRLSGLAQGDRVRLARALARDTVDALLSSRLVERCVVVGPQDLRWPVMSPRVTRVVESRPELNAAVRTGLRVATRARPQGILVTVADLPLLDGGAVDDLLESVGEDEPSQVVVRDDEGSGTTMLAGRRAQSLRPSFGTGSAARHLAIGGVEAPPGTRRELRVDLDTWADLTVLAERPGSRGGLWYRQWCETHLMRSPAG